MAYFLDGLAVKPKTKIRSTTADSVPKSPRPKDKNGGNGAMVFLYLLLAGTVVAFLVSKLPSKTSSSVLPKQVANISNSSSPPPQSVQVSLEGRELKVKGENIEANKETISESLTAEEKTEAKTENKKEVAKISGAVRVLNGTEIEGLANKIKTQLEKSGFQVKTVGDARYKYLETIIYYQPGKEDLAKKIAEALSDRKSNLKESAIAKPDDILVVAGER